MLTHPKALLVPMRICSLSLVSTAARVENTTTFVENLRTRINMFVPKSLDRSVCDSSKSLFPDSWLDAPDSCVVPTASTPNVDLPASGSYGKFDLNYTRFAAQESAKRLDTESFTKKGFILQAIAAGWHHKSKKQLEELGDKVGRERICVMHGTMDNMITVYHGRVLIEELKPGTSYIKEGSGHVLMLELTAWHDEVIEEMVQKTEAMGKK
jgi:hypothetical protein